MATEIKLENSAEELHRKLFANSEIMKRNTPDLYAEEIAQIEDAFLAERLKGFEYAKR